MPQDQDQPRNRFTKKWLVVGGAVIGLLLMGTVAFFTWNTVAESRRKAKAEEAVRSALTLWCSDQPLPDLDAAFANTVYQFSEFGTRIPTDPRPTSYQISTVSWVRGGAYSVYQIPVTLTFIGGPETRLYEVEVHKQSGKCFINTRASEDVSGTESHARSILQAWLDSWATGEDLTTFKRKHPEVAGEKMTDFTWGDLMSKGKRLVSHDITTTTTAPGNKFRYTVTAVLEERGTPETKILRYSVYKDRPLGGGRWCITGN